MSNWIVSDVLQYLKSFNFADLDLEIIYIYIYIYKLDLALNKLQLSICNKTKPVYEPK